MAVTSHSRYSVPTTATPEVLEADPTLGDIDADLATDSTHCSLLTSYSIPADGSPVTISTHLPRECANYLGTASNNSSPCSVSRAQTSPHTSPPIPAGRNYSPMGQPGSIDFKPKQSSVQSSPEAQGPSSSRRSPRHQHLKSTTSLLIEYFEATPLNAAAPSSPMTANASSKSRSSLRVRVTPAIPSPGPSHTIQSGPLNSHPAPKLVDIREANQSPSPRGPPTSGTKTSPRGPALSGINTFQPPSEISSIPSDSLLDGPGLRMPDEAPFIQDSGLDLDSDSLQVPSLSRTRSQSRERLTQRVVEKVITKEKEDAARRRGSRHPPSKSERPYHSSQTPSKSHPQQQSVPPHRSGSSPAPPVPQIKNPKLIATVEDAIRRLILPEISAIKDEQNHQTSNIHRNRQTRKSLKSPVNLNDSEGQHLDSKSSSREHTRNRHYVHSKAATKAHSRNHPAPPKDDQFHHERSSLDRHPCGGESPHSFSAFDHNFLAENPHYSVSMPQHRSSPDHFVSATYSKQDPASVKRKKKKRRSQDADSHPNECANNCRMNTPNSPSTATHIANVPRPRPDSQPLLHDFHHKFYSHPAKNIASGELPVRNDNRSQNHTTRTNYSPKAPKSTNSTQPDLSRSSDKPAYHSSKPGRSSDSRKDAESHSQDSWSRSWEDCYEANGSRSSSTPTPRHSSSSPDSKGREAFKSTVKLHSSQLNPSDSRRAHEKQTNFKSHPEECEHDSCNSDPYDISAESDEFFRRAHEANQRYRSELNLQSGTNLSDYDPKRLTAITEKTESPDQVIREPQIYASNPNTLNHVGQANPQIVTASHGVESAVASILDSSHVAPEARSGMDDTPSNRNSVVIPPTGSSRDGNHDSPRFGCHMHPPNSSPSPSVMPLGDNSNPKINAHEHDNVQNTRGYGHLSASTPAKSPQSPKGTGAGPDRNRLGSPNHERPMHSPTISHSNLLSSQYPQRNTNNHHADSPIYHHKSADHQQRLPIRCSGIRQVTSDDTKECESPKNDQDAGGYDTVSDDVYPYAPAQKREPNPASGPNWLDSPISGSSMCGADQIKSKDVVALMDHLTVRDAQRNARDTEILVTLVRSAAEMRNQFESIKQFIMEQDQMLMVAAEKKVDSEVAKVLHGSQPYAIRKNISGEASYGPHDDSPVKKSNLFRRALKGLSLNRSSDLTKIERMLMHLLDEVEGLKTNGVASADQSNSPGTSRREDRSNAALENSLTSYENLRARDPLGHSPENAKCPRRREVTPDSSGFVSNDTAKSPTESAARRGPGSWRNHCSHSGKELDRYSVSPENALALADTSGDNRDVSTPTMEAHRGYGTQANMIVSGLSVDSSPEQHPDQTSDEDPANYLWSDPKHKSTGSSLFGIPRISRWSKTTTESPDEASLTRSGARRRPNSDSSHTHSTTNNDMNGKQGRETPERGPSDRLRPFDAGSFIGKSTITGPEGSTISRSPSPLVPSGARSMLSFDDPKYQAHRDSINLQHPQPRQGPTGRHQNYLETAARDFDPQAYGLPGGSSDVSSVSGVTRELELEAQFGSAPALALGHRVSGIKTYQSSPSRTRASHYEPLIPTEFSNVFNSSVSSMSALDRRSSRGNGSDNYYYENNGMKDQYDVMDDYRSSHFRRSGDFEDEGMPVARGPTMDTLPPPENTLESYKAAPPLAPIMEVQSVRCSADGDGASSLFSCDGGGRSIATNSPHPSPLGHSAKGSVKGPRDMPGRELEGCRPAMSSEEFSK